MERERKKDRGSIEKMMSKCCLIIIKKSNPEQRHEQEEKRTRVTSSNLYQIPDTHPDHLTLSGGLCSDA